MTVAAPRPTIGQIARRIGLLRTGVEYLGKERAAAALGIEPRSLRAKLEASRGVYDDNLRLVATALERHAAEALAHATTIRATLASAPAGDGVRHGLGPHALTFADDDEDGFTPVATLRGRCVYIQQGTAQITLSPDVADRLAAALALQSQPAKMTVAEEEA